MPCTFLSAWHLPQVTLFDEGCIFQTGDKAFFVYGFSKSNRDNLDKDELATFKKSAKQLLSLSDPQINELIKNGALMEVRP